MRLTVLLCLLACGCSSGASQADIDGDVERFRGTWAPLSMVYDGDDPGPDHLHEHLFVTEEAFFAPEAELDEARQKLQLDPSKEPKTFDLNNQRDHEKLRGIYQFKGDTVTLCYVSSQAGKDLPRPRDFDSQPGSKRWLILARKQQEKE